ncbi:MAG: ATP-binding cassette domain-containing protein [bacterium]|nr:ATP-binding cassette domain-containing protein [bacterium]
MTQPAIILDAVSKTFGANPVLRDASLRVDPGETIAILGASGSGKSVTLKAINGLIHPDGGTIEVLGQEVSNLTEAELVPLRRRVSYLFQGGALFDSMNVFDNIAFPLREHRDLQNDELATRVGELLSLIHLEGVDTLMPSELSGGMKKRVALARALALEPEIILYDEPTTGLDPVTGRAIAALIMDLHKRLGVTSVVVTHDIPLVVEVAQRIVFLENGQFIFSGTISEARRVAPEQVRQFFSPGGSDA